jgi:hypothetical protein
MQLEDGWLVDARRVPSPLTWIIWLFVPARLNIADLRPQFTFHLADCRFVVGREEMPSKPRNEKHSRRIQFHTRTP